jgi:hypothetical protein
MCPGSAFGIGKRTSNTALVPRAGWYVLGLPAGYVKGKFALNGAVVMLSGYLGRGVGESPSFTVNAHSHSHGKVRRTKHPM